MLRQAVYSILIFGLAQGLPAAAQSTENFSVESSSASDPTVKLVDLTGVDPDDYDEDSLTPALIEKLHEQRLEAEMKDVIMVINNRVNDLRLYLQNFQQCEVL